MYGLLGVVVLFELFPIYFVLVTAFKSELQIQQVRGMFWPDPWTLEQFTFLFTRIRFVEWYRNTTIIALASTTVSVLVASLGAYGMVRLRWRGASTLGATVLVANLMPGALMVIPMYIILAQLRLINTHWALLVTYPSFVLPFATWLMMGYYRSIPEEVEDAALIDGCNRLQAFFLVVLPLVRPALLAVGLFSFTAAWNEFLYAYTFLQDGEPVHAAGRAGRTDHRRHPAVGAADGRLDPDGGAGRDRLHAGPEADGGRPDGRQRQGVGRGSLPGTSIRSLDALRRAGLWGLRVSGNMVAWTPICSRPVCDLCENA